MQDAPVNDVAHSPRSASPWEIRLRWGLVGLFFVLLVAMALEGRSTKKEETTSGPTTQQITAMELVFRTQSLMLMASNQASNPDPSSLRDTANDLRAEAAKDDRSAMLFAVAQTELERDIPEPVLKRLRESKNDAHRAAAEVFGAEKLTKARASELAAKVERITDIGPMVAVQAFEKSGDTKAVSRYFPPGPLLFMTGAMMALCFGALLGSALWIVFFTQRNKPSWRPQGHPFNNLNYDQASKMGLLAVAWIGLFLIVGVVSDVLFRGLPEFVGMLLTTLTFLGLMAASLFVVRLNEVPLIRQLNQSQLSVGKQIAIGLAGWAANLPVLGVLLMALLPLLRSTQASHPLNDMMAQSDGIGMVIALFVAAAISAPLWEEIAFRGALFGGLSRALKGPVGMVVAAAVSSLAFAAIHPQGPAAWLMLGWIGAMGCILTHYTRSLIPAIVMHAVHNGVLVLMSFVLLG